MTYDEYDELVFNYAEYLGVPELVQNFEVIDVALSFSRTMVISYQLRLSFRMCAIILFSLTLTMQVMPLAQSTTKH